MIVASVLFVFGLVFGSFVNALTWRVRKQDELAENGVKPTSVKNKSQVKIEDRRLKVEGGKNKKHVTPSEGEADKSRDKTEGYSILRGRSMCPHCRHTLSAWDLVPVASWLALRGKCRYCRKPIGWQYPAVEVATGLLFAASYLAWPHTLDTLGMVSFCLWLAALVLLVALTVYDFRWRELPDVMVWPLTVVGAASVLLGAPWWSDLSLLWQPVLGAAVIFGLFYGLYQVSAGRWIGGGDVKIALGLGLLSGGAVQALLIIFFASVIGTLTSLPLLIRSRTAKIQIPFGPALIAATIIVVLYGQKLIDWYLGLLRG